MFVLDTNILSAMMRPERVPEVAAWMDAQDEESLFTTSISHAEIFAGLAVMPDGRRRRMLQETADAMFGVFEGRVMPFDTDAAASYAVLFALRRQMGRPTAPLDLMIAAIARTHDAVLVTRNTKDFQGCGLTLVDPWETA